MNAAERLAALEALLARVQRNAAERRGDNGAAAALQPAEPRRVEVERPAAVARRSDRPADGARLERLLAKAWDTWGDDPGPRPPETLTELLGQPVPRGPREPADAAPAPAPPPARDEPELTGRSILAPELEEALLKAASERPPPIVPPAVVAPLVPPPLSSAPPVSIGSPLSGAPPLSSIPDSLGRAGLSRRRARLRRWFLSPRSAHRRSMPGLSWKQLAAALLVALPLVVGAIYLVRREPSSARGAPPGTPTVRLDAASARVALDPPADSAANRPGPSPTSREPAEAPAADGATLAPDRGYVVVKTAAPGRAYFNGVLAGETNVRLEVACGWRNLRLARPAMPGPGQSYPIWAGEGRPVLIACQSTTTLEMDGR